MFWTTALVRAFSTMPARNMVKLFAHACRMIITFSTENRVAQTPQHALPFCAALCQARDA